ncbi:2-dehydro-3-deoxy-D-gluconate 5-dehydrogenase [Hartmannibacter diazotrophicus]|uniref:2-dehydro-3-deoxy-D-gluconate 5-dehydrogenase n=1 Tax=Hartmannibacter diazotrophicus TaxID=1482074 RepID=A0A2C9D178_9HYPH|nr:SDR family oxidoreductase [Hartmannibacter diazotrophicus]SON53561.1 2-dehydro-3-deoxy-D-gluconate 5-dehydrogenase [Hartmannibacter diazotrophicus]
MSTSRASYPDLAGKTVFVTGGGSGIGAALVTAFARQGARVAFVDIAEEESRALVESIRQAGKGDALFLPCDLRDIAGLRRAIEEAGRQFGDISILLNNAANDERHQTLDVTPEEWDARMAINLKPQFFAAQAVLPQMIRLGSGSIVNFGSITWRLGQGGMAAYSTAKAGIHGLTRSLSRDFGPHRVRVNTLLPGWVMTERQLKFWVNPESLKEMEAGQCLPDRIDPQDIADMALFLGSDASSKCTAQEFVVDAGWS